MSNLRTYWNKTIALMIVSAFVYLQVTAINCNVHHLFDAEKASQHQPLENPVHHSHGDDPGKDHHGGDGHDENEKGCCNDFTQFFLSSFAKSTTLNVDFSLKNFSVDIASPYRPMRLTSYCFAPVGIVNEPPFPPPKIPDIRVFILSFQI